MSATSAQALDCPDAPSHCHHCMPVHSTCGIASNLWEAKATNLAIRQAKESSKPVKCAILICFAEMQACLPGIGQGCWKPYRYPVYLGRLHTCKQYIYI